MACGKRTEKASGGRIERRLQPLYTKVNMNNLPDGIYHVTFDQIVCQN